MSLLGAIFGGDALPSMLPQLMSSYYGPKPKPVKAELAKETLISGPANASIADTQAMKAQRDALEMTRANTSQGLNRAESDNLNLGINRVNRNTAARSNAISQQNAARGLGGSGLDAALKASAEQGGANAASESGIQAQESANQRALGSISQLGGMGAQINQQQFMRGQAQDALNQWNAGTQNQFALANQNATNSVNLANSGQSAAAQQALMSSIQNQGQFNAQMQMQQQQAYLGLLGAGMGAGATAYGASSRG